MGAALVAPQHCCGPGAVPWEQCLIAPPAVPSQRELWELEDTNHPLSYSSACLPVCYSLPSSVPSIQHPFTPLPSMHACTHPPSIPPPISPSFCVSHLSVHASHLSICTIRPHLHPSVQLSVYPGTRFPSLPSIHPTVPPLSVCPPPAPPLAQCRCLPFAPPAGRRDNGRRSRGAAGSRRSFCAGRRGGEKRGHPRGVGAQGGAICACTRGSHQP